MDFSWNKFLLMHRFVTLFSQKQHTCYLGRYEHVTSLSTVVIPCFMLNKQYTDLTILISIQCVDTITAIFCMYSPILDFHTTVWHPFKPQKFLFYFIVFTSNAKKTLIFARRFHWLQINNRTTIYPNDNWLHYHLKSNTRYELAHVFASRMPIEIYA